MPDINMSVFKLQLKDRSAGGAVLFNNIFKKGDVTAQPGGICRL